MGYPLGVTAKRSAPARLSRRGRRLDAAGRACAHPALYLRTLQQHGVAALVAGQLACGEGAVEGRTRQRVAAHRPLMRMKMGKEEVMAARPQLIGGER